MIIQTQMISIQNKRSKRDIEIIGYNSLVLIIVRNNSMVLMIVNNNSSIVWMLITEKLFLLNFFHILIAFAPYLTKNALV